MFNDQGSKCALNVSIFQVNGQMFKVSINFLFDQWNVELLLRISRCGSRFAYALDSFKFNNYNFKLMVLSFMLTSVSCW